MKITSALFEAFLKCPTKCYLRSTGQAGSGNAYAEWVREQNDNYRAGAATRLMIGVPEAEVVVAPPAAEDLKAAKWRLALDLPVQAGDMETRIHAVRGVEPMRTPFETAAALNELPPNSFEAERGLLGCILVGGPGIMQLAKAAGVSPPWFYDLKHRMVWDAIYEAQKNGAVDFITVSEQLRRSGKLEEIGGTAYLQELDAGVPSAANAPYWIEIAQEKFQDRTALQGLARIGELLKSTTERNAKFMDLESALISIRQLLAPGVLAAVSKLSDLPSKQRSDPDELIRYRFLCRAGGCFGVGQPVLGKAP